MARFIAVLFGVGLVVVAASPASAAVWRCHTPTGDVWTNQPEGYGDCEEFAGTYYPSAEPPAYPSPPVPSVPEQVMPPPPPVYESAPPPLYPPYDDPFYYSPYVPGVYLYPPWFGFRFGHGPRFGHGGHFGGHRFGGERGFGRGHGGGRAHSFGGGRGGHGGEHR